MAAFAHPLLDLPKFGSGVGLHRVRYLMDELGISDNIREKVVVVTGSNGKGSTSKISSELLRLSGAKVGLFTSPHLYRYNERFQIDGRPISDIDLQFVLDEVYRAVSRYHSRRNDEVGAFEAQFVAALKYFDLRNTTWMVLEAGIGGRYDPVRLVQAPVSALVSLDFEHTELLGRSLQEIAFDKLDATARGGMAILGESCQPFRTEIETYGRLTDVELGFVNQSDWKDLGYADGWQLFELNDSDLGNLKLRSRLVGRHQINNHAVAIRLCKERLRQANLWPQPAIATLWTKAIERVEWPGRLEKVQVSPAIYIDVGHTPEGIRAALAGFEVISGKRKSILVTGGSKNKNVKQMLEILAPRFDRIICTAAYHNGLNATEVASMAGQCNPQADVEPLENIEEAVAKARREATTSNSIVYVAGGLFLAAEFAECCRGGEPAKLRFF